MKFILYQICKPLAKLLKLELFDGETMEFFMKLVLDAMKYRKEHKIVRNDMINMLMEARGMGVDDNPVENLKSQQDWTDIEIVAQCFLFFLAGFETTATVLSFTAHEIMENPDVQNKLLQEIQDVKESLGEEPLTFEVLNGMNYLDQVVSESMRKWPPAPGTDRLCTKDITFENPDGLGNVYLKEGESLFIPIAEGESLFIPIAGLHRDPKYFENPNVFDPERFSEENKHSIQPFTYMPFGVGPRSCIGNRLALMEAKTMLFYLIDKFELLPSEKSTIPLDLTGGGLQLKPKNGFWLKLKQR
uniref:Cytochrome P450 n=1 Tax=Megaselia scalaris TaxID=36166 RepID=T1H172_MEGSC